MLALRVSSFNNNANMESGKNLIKTEKSGRGGASQMNL